MSLLKFQVLEGSEGAANSPRSSPPRPCPSPRGKQGTPRKRGCFWFRSGPAYSNASPLKGMLLMPSKNPQRVKCNVQVRFLTAHALLLLVLVFLVNGWTREDRAAVLVTGESKECPPATTNVTYVPVAPKIKWNAPGQWVGLLHSPASEKCQCRNWTHAYMGPDGSPGRSPSDVWTLLQGSRVAIVGDTVTTQMFWDGFLCGPVSMGLKYSVEDRYFAGVTDEDTVKSLVDDGKIMRVRDFPAGEPLPKSRWLKVRAESIKGHWSLYCVDHMPGEEEDPKEVKTAALWPAILEHILANHDVVIINIGLYYHRWSKEELATYWSHLKELAKRLETFNAQPGKLAALRETTPQHFATEDPAGDWEGVKEEDFKVEDHIVRNKKHVACGPIKDPAIQNWRNKAMAEVAKNFKIPLQKIFEPLAADHMAGAHWMAPPRGPDCTHFNPAFAPCTFAPVYDSMYRLVKKHYEYKAPSHSHSSSSKSSRSSTPSSSSSSSSSSSPSTEE